MNTVNKTSRILGVAFLIQFITSFSSGLFLRPKLIVPGSISETMFRIADQPTLMKATILTDMLTALGVIFLGAILFLTLRQQNEKLALTALGFYILEGALVAASRADAFKLLRLSQEYVTAGQPAYLPTLANLALESMDFVGLTLHMLAFCIGGILFYFLLYKSQIVPSALSLWGLITILPLLITTLLGIFDIEVPFFMALPYVPFEFVIGLWILVKGIRDSSETRLHLAHANAI